MKKKKILSLFNENCNSNKYQLIKRQNCHHVETSQLICSAVNESTALYFLPNQKYSEKLKKFGQQPAHNHPKLVMVVC